ncbi:hypothetical protein N7495_006106 [Penicillium taxi]|uniref:uncharacterized protein n=1 Tax=Penicillium taxi TaxID=168475 RepID=UPI0025456C8B|nr:uncharacterized protein N7495_006106 [Penicillium taxi]KAJ5894415.1 hypothetical protein N7495_006106 [Penicillium taxi]
MSSSILHQCPFCNHVSDISLSLPEFIENPHCNQCGLSASESTEKLHELAALFDQMTMCQVQPECQPPPISYSISRHYHHSSHIIPQNPTPTNGTKGPIISPKSISPPAEDLEIEMKMDISEEVAVDHKEEAEPYMVSGYNAYTLPKEPTTGETYTSATDPVYQSRHWWENTQMGMEPQYVAFEERNRDYVAGDMQTRWMGPN